MAPVFDIEHVTMSFLGMGVVEGGGWGDKVSAQGPNTNAKTKREPQSPARGAKCSCPANEILKWPIMPP